MVELKCAGFLKVIGNKILGRVFNPEKPLHTYQFIFQESGDAAKQCPVEVILMHWAMKREGVASDLRDGLQFHLLPSDLPSQNLNLFTYKLGFKKFYFFKVLSNQKFVLRIK